MKLAPESQRRIERFLRSHFHNEELKLPTVHVYDGWFARWLTGRLRILAITFGRRILIAPKVVKRDEENRLTVPAALIAHEVTHVMQYDETGFAGFLVSYVGEFFRVLRNQQQGWGKAARNAAYFGIKQERQAYEAEAAYSTWDAIEKMIESRQD